MLIQVSNNCALVDGINYGTVSDAMANNPCIVDIIAHAATAQAVGAPLAVDMRGDCVGAALHALPLPDLPDGWTRLLASDYADGDEYIDHEAVTDADGNVIAPAYREQIASGVVKEHSRRAAEWAASQPVPAPAPEPIPEEVTARAFRLALRAVTGIKPSTVTEVMKLIPDEGQREDAMSEWEYANTISRSNALLPVFSSQFGVTDAQLADIFRAAAKL